MTVRKYMRGYPPHRSFAAISLYTAGILTVLMLIFGRVSALAEQEPRTLGLVVLSAAIGISLGHVLMYYVLGHLGAIIESGAEMVTPFVTFLGAALLFGERLSALQWAGGLGVIAGCASYDQRPQRRPRTRAAEVGPVASCHAPVAHPVTHENGLRGRPPGSARVSRACACVSMRLAGGTPAVPGYFRSSFSCAWGAPGDA